MIKDDAASGTSAVCPSFHRPVSLVRVPAGNPPVGFMRHCDSGYVTSGMSYRILLAQSTRSREIGYVVVDRAQDVRL